MVEIRQLGPQIGVEVRGVDVKTMDDDALRRIYQAWLDHNVMCVRGQDLTIPDFIRYSERFGPVTPHPSKSTRHPEYPKITLLGINKFDADGKLRDEIYRRGAEGWHTDGAYNQAPFKATQLYALAVPSRGGNTLFANAYAAYDALPQRLKDRLDGVIGAFSYGGRRGKVEAAQPRGPGLEAGLSPDHPHPSRDRPQIALFRSRQDRRFCRHRARRGRRADRRIEGAHDHRPTPSTITNGKRATS